MPLARLFKNFGVISPNLLFGTHAYHLREKTLARTVLKAKCLFHFFIKTRLRSN